MQSAAPPQASSAIAEPPKPLPTVVAGTPSRSNPVGLVGRLNEQEATPRSSVAGSPVPDGLNTPQPPREASAAGGGPGEGGSFGATSIFFDPTVEKIKIAEERDRILPMAGLDTAIMTSIQQGARGDDRKARDFYGGIMVIGGGSKTAGFMPYLEDRLRALLPGLGKDILIGAPPRDLDPQVLVWKGGSVFGKLSTSGNDSWVSQKEYDMLGSRLLMNKCMFLW